MKQFQARNIEVISCVDGISSLKNRLSFRHKLVEAGEESDVLSERIKGAIKFIRENTNGRIGPAPFGFRNIRGDQIPGGSYRPLRLENNENEMLMISEIIYYVENQTNLDTIAEEQGVGICNVIADHLNAEGKLKRGKMWNAWMVKEVYKRFSDNDQIPIFNIANEVEDDTQCEICHELHSIKGNEMLLCDGCDKGFHIRCIYRSNVPKGKFYCSLHCQFNKSL